MSSKETKPPLFFPFCGKPNGPLSPLDINRARKEIEEEEDSDEEQQEQEIISVDKNDCAEEINEEKGLECIKEECSAISNDEDSFDLGFSNLDFCTPAKAIVNKNQCRSAYAIPSVFKTPLTKHPFFTPKENSAFSRSKTKKPEINENKVIFSTSMVKNKTQNIPFKSIFVNNIEYFILNVLGKGGSSIVYQCFCVEKQLIVAIKCVSLDKEESVQGYLNEVELLKKLRNCDRIIRLIDYEIIQENKKLYLVLERGGKDLSAVLKNISTNNLFTPLYKITYYWIEMLLAVKQIHDNGIIHSDLKPSNFLIGNEGLKLIDFGIASTVVNDMTCAFKSCPEGSCNYISPEALSNSGMSPSKSKYKIHFKSDVWSLGCILYQLVYKRTPFHQFHTLWEKLAYITNPSHVIHYPEVNLPHHIIDTIKKCLCYNVKNRPTVDELLKECNL